MRSTSDLSDTEWLLLDDCFPKPRPTGRPRKHRHRELLNAIFHLTKTACQWRDYHHAKPVRATENSPAVQRWVAIAQSRQAPKA